MRNEYSIHINTWKHETIIDQYGESVIKVYCWYITARTRVHFSIVYYTNIEWLKVEWEEYYRKVKFTL